jgi:hypothetical protein
VRFFYKITVLAGTYCTHSLRFCVSGALFRGFKVIPPSGRSKGTFASAVNSKRSLRGWGTGDQTQKAEACFGPDTNRTGALRARKKRPRGKQRDQRGIHGCHRIPRTQRARSRADRPTLFTTDSLPRAEPLCNADVERANKQFPPPIHRSLPAAFPSWNHDRHLYHIPSW